MKAVYHTITALAAIILGELFILLISPLALVLWAFLAAYLVATNWG